MFDKVLLSVGMILSLTASACKGEEKVAGCNDEAVKQTVVGIVLGGGKETFLNTAKQAIKKIGGTNQPSEPIGTIRPFVTGQPIPPGWVLYQDRTNKSVDAWIKGTDMYLRKEKEEPSPAQNNLKHIQLAVDLMESTQASVYAIQQQSYKSENDTRYCTASLTYEWGSAYQNYVNKMTGGGPVSAANTIQSKTISSHPLLGNQQPLLVTSLALILSGLVPNREAPEFYFCNGMYHYKIFRTLDQAPDTFMVSVNCDPKQPEW